MSHRKDDPEAMVKMDQWLSAVSANLDFDYDVIEQHKKNLLALISTVAHGPSRPGAPLTAFIVGYVAGATGADASELAAKIQKLAEDFN